LANCATFISLVGAADAAAAEADSIYVDDIPDPADKNRYTSSEYAALLPYALVTHSDEEPFEIEYDAVGHFHTSGAIVIEIQKAMRETQDAENFRQFKDDIGAIAIEFGQQGETAGRIVRPNLRRFTIKRAAEPREKTTGLDDVHKAIFFVEWGITAGGGSSSD
jgi:hypothetical protein